MSNNNDRNAADSTLGNLSGWPHSQYRKRKLDVAFTGSGSEYFRIWIVNLLLSLVTLGLYLPFAKARRLSYFYSNTLIDGQALGFHGDPWKMLRGFLLLAVLTLAYGFAARFSPLSAMAAFALLCGLWPALWRAGLQFRLANTSWRGLRLGFTGSSAGAYAALLPLYVPALLMVAGQFLFAPERPDPRAPMPLLLGLSMAASFLLMLLMLPWGVARIKRYQHGGYVYADQQTELTVPTRRFYGLGLKALLLTLLPLALLGALAAIAVAVYKPLLFWMMLALPLAYLLYFALITPYVSARLQNLVWNGTASELLQLQSDLPARPLAWLTLKNWLLTALTLGLYRPFAAVHTARMRLQAMSLMVEGDLDGWVARQSVAQDDAAGDAAGDFFGIDMGL
ncbi:YjgN family protein [Paucibacter sediminis]|uniref:YjgN family protein n=1 Tax=Paucibacter sediminis TaxID=3019553 RepID=A0AA95NH64_9BURK|nr:YjgN family protein [Paucibacter sp. S2-9]WIT13022.1 YjgN family protein [Paucibacter sp. S2-9]